MPAVAAMLPAVGAMMASALAAWWFTRRYRRWALHARLLDVPGARSSHQVVTPTGGGVGLIAGFLAGAAPALAMTVAGWDWLLVLVLVPLLAALGYRDDRDGLPVAPRLLAQVGAAAALVMVIVPGDGVAWGAVDAGVLCAAVFAIVWLNNVFNFMDGIDGLAASQGVFMAATAALLCATGGGGPDSVLVLGAAAGAALGFLVLNWPPASLFMGDAGSQSLGFLLAAATLITVVRGEMSAAVWLILWAVFLSDATLTLLHRAVLRKNLMHAHRDHAYQRLARISGGHRTVTLGLLALNLCWLLPLALLARAWPAAGAPVVAIAYAPLCLALLLVLRRDAAPAARSRADGNRE